MESQFDVTSSSDMIRSNENDIDEVFPRMYMSGWKAAENWDLIEKLGITHILAATPGASKRFEHKGIKYILFTEAKDHEDQDLL